jgi:hypothetical protein
MRLNGQEFFGSFFQERTSFLQKRSKKLLRIKNSLAAGRRAGARPGR